MGQPRQNSVTNGHIDIDEFIWSSGRTGGSKKDSLEKAV